MDGGLQMQRKNEKYLIRGCILSGEQNVGNLLLVEVIVSGAVVWQGDVGPDGLFQKEFEWSDPPPTIELRVVPKEVANLVSPFPFLSAHTAVPAFKHVGAENIADVVMGISPSYIELAGPLVSAGNFVLSGVVSADQDTAALKAVRLYFRAAIDGSEEGGEYLGETTTDVNGYFAFTCEKTPSRNALWATVLQLQEDTWHELHRERVVLTGARTVKKLSVPATAELLVPTGNAPRVSDGDFMMTAISNLAWPPKSISDGYVTSENDRLKLTHQPLCGNLRFFGSFNVQRQVTKYAVCVAEVPGGAEEPQWRPLNEPVTNLKWQQSLGRWNQICLGPKDGKYDNIDRDPATDWFEPLFKFAWTTSKWPDGLYTLRIEGFDASGGSVVGFVIPPLRISNRQPDIKLEALNADQPVGPCGCVFMPVADRTIRFLVTAWDARGHIHEVKLDGKRGPKNDAAGEPGVPVAETHPDNSWTGYSSSTVRSFKVQETGCTSVAYRFDLTVTGTATDCRSRFTQCWPPAGVNLIVTKTRIKK